MIILFLEGTDTCKQILDYIGIVIKFHNCTREREERQTDREADTELTAHTYLGSIPATNIILFNCCTSHKSTGTSL